MTQDIDILTSDQKDKLEDIFEAQTLKDKQLPKLASTQDNQTYYRSRLYAPKQALNPILASAQPLLSLLTRLLGNKQWPDFSILSQVLLHEFKAFETALQSTNISDETQLLVRYLLIATFDDCVDAHSQENDIPWQTHYLHDHFGHKDTDNEHFFSILKRGMEYPSAHLEMLELIYYCLLFGYQGQYRKQKQGTDTLQSLRDDLYKLIVKHRKTEQAQFYNVPTRWLQTKTPLPKLRTKTILSCAFGLSIAIILGVAYLLDLSSQPLLEQVSAFNQHILEIPQMNIGALIGGAA